MHTGSQQGPDATNLPCYSCCSTVLASHGSPSRDHASLPTAPSLSERGRHCRVGGAVGGRIAEAQERTAERPKAFISYSRADSSALAEELVPGLELLDKHDTEKGVDWEERLGALILKADTCLHHFAGRGALRPLPVGGPALERLHGAVRSH